MKSNVPWNRQAYGTLSIKAYGTLSIKVNDEPWNRQAYGTLSIKVNDEPWNRQAYGTLSIKVNDEPWNRQAYGTLSIKASRPPLFGVGTHDTGFHDKLSWSMSVNAYFPSYLKYITYDHEKVFQSPELLFDVVAIDYNHTANDHSVEQAPPTPWIAAIGPVTDRTGRPLVGSETINIWSSMTYPTYGSCVRPQTIGGFRGSCTRSGKLQFLLISQIRGVTISLPWEHSFLNEV
uniref:Uncharacterized protein n=1 Tax=Solanum tuberosum TaxID=4113 RepID=M1DIL7_SOLTU